MGIWTPGPGASSGNDRFVGDSSDETAYGGDGNDRMDGKAGTDILFGEQGEDTLESGSDGAGDDEMYGGSQDDHLIMRRFSGSTDEVLAHGGSGDDSFTIQMYGGRGRALGGAGNDYFNIISGGELNGGSGVDTFDFNTLFSISPSRPVVTLLGFETGASGDIIKLDGLVSDLTNYGGGNPFATGHFRLHQDGAHTLFQVDTNGGGNSWQTVMLIRKTDPGDFTAENFDGVPPDGSAVLFTPEPVLADLLGEFRSVDEDVAIMALESPYDTYDFV